MRNRATLNSYIKINFERLETALKELADLVSLNMSHNSLFQLPLIEIGEENQVLKKIEIECVHNQVNEDSRLLVRQSISNMRIDAFAENTYLAKRYPGVIVLPNSLKKNFVELNKLVNELRQQFSLSVKVGFKNRQAIHQNLHELIPNIVLLSATRNLKYLDAQDAQISSVNFFWRSKKMTKHINHNDAIKILDKSMDSKNYECFGLTKAELIERNRKEQERISRVPSNSTIAEIRFARVQPMIDIWCKQSCTTRSQRLLSTNATLPAIIFDKPLKINNLSNYEYRKPTEIKHPVLIQRKHWYMIK